MIEKLKKVVVVVVAFTIFFSQQNFCVILEQLVKNKALDKFFQGKVVGFYLGSFDPLHVGHERIAEMAVKLKNSSGDNFCNSVLVYPTWGKDNYKPKSPIEARLKILEAVFADHQDIIITFLPPKKLQQLLFKQSFIRVPSRLQWLFAKKNPLHFNFGIKEFIGILGSDNALKLGLPSSDPEEEESRKAHLEIYMRGLAIPKEYEEHSLGSVMAIPVAKFIVAIRSEDDIDELNNMIVDRPIIGVFNVDSSYLRTSSTEIRRIVSSSERLSEISGELKHKIHPRVLSLIYDENLYNSKSDPA